MNITQYLERINYVEPLQPTFEVLSKLQRLHLSYVPFENLDIHNRIRIDLSNLFDKIVTRKRGGFCYELNGLFYQLLKEIGFTLKMVSVRVYDPKKGYSPEFDHMALIATIAGDSYLVDVGFGEFSFYPLKIELDKEIADPAGIFKIETINESYKVIKKKNANGLFIPEYIFSEKERQLEEFYHRCNHHQQSRESHFMQKRICSLPTENGRITLTGDILKMTENGKITEMQLTGEQQVQDVLLNYFGIKL